MSSQRQQVKIGVNDLYILQQKKEKKKGFHVLVSKISPI